MNVATSNTGAWQLPPSLSEDLANFAKTVAQFRAGAISATEFQVFRVPQGVYEQRDAGTFMLRVRLPAGVLLPSQMWVLADVATQYGDGVLHVTTRQDIQIHRVLVESIHPALTTLATAGLSTKGGGGNTVRNISGCSQAGVCAQEVFDITPHAIALTEFMLADKRSFQLPRKFKIAFSGCDRDCSGAIVNDVGLIATSRNGRDGFVVHVGGGMGSSSRVADRFEEFVPASDLPLVVEAIKRVFDLHGNRKDKRQARLRFLLRQMGLARFRMLYEEQLQTLRTELPSIPAPRSLIRPPNSAPLELTNEPRSSDYIQWRATNVRAQKQSGFVFVEIPLLLGDISASTLRSLAAVVETHGERMLRAVQEQNLILRWVSRGELPSLHARLAAIGLAESQPPVLRNMIACTGAATCKLGICLSRGLAKAIATALDHCPVDLHALGELRLSLSGCPNACGRHPIAQIGLHGAARRVDGQLVPHYVLQLGGRLGAGQTQLATGRYVLPARNVPAFLAELLSAFAHSGQQPDFHAFLQANREGVIESLAAKYKTVPRFDDDKNFYYDWGAEKPFSLAGRGPGECGAGVMDLIEVDLKSADEALAEGRYLGAAGLASRALLVTRGEQPASEADSFRLFQKHFLDSGLVDARFQPLVAWGVEAGGITPSTIAPPGPQEVAQFVGAVRELYQQMDASLRFTKPACATQLPKTIAKTTPAQMPIDLERDFRGVVCPLNYVKTRMALEKLKPGQVLAVLLDADGARNVPESAAKEGHEVRSISQVGNHWRVEIRKAGA